MDRVANILAVEMLERRVELTHLPHGWYALVGILLTTLLLYAVVSFYRRERRAGASPRARAVLAALRSAVIVTLILIWLQPILATYLHRKVESSTLLLVDGSASMGLRDRYAEPAHAARVTRALQDLPGADPARMTRAELADTLLTRDRQHLLRQLAASNPVQIYQFGDKLARVGQVSAESDAARKTNERGSGRAGEREPRSNGGTQPAAERSELATKLTDAHEPATDVGRAVRQAIEAQSGGPIAGIVVLSDGRFNQGEPAEVVARYARSRRIPIYTVGIGDPAPPRNVAVTGLEAPPNVFVKDPFTVTAHLRAQGLDGATLTVELLERAAGADHASLADTRTLTVGPGGTVPPIVFHRQIGQACEVTLQLRVPPQPGETMTADNQREITVRVLEAKMRVLLVSGGPTWEYRYLARLLQRDATVNLSCWLQSADEEAVRDGTTLIDHFPRTPEELSPYDAIILLDPQPGDFDPAWAAQVEALVGNTGGGLLYVAGRKNAPRFAHDPNTRALLDLLPVVIDPNESDLVINELGHFQASAWPLAVPPKALASPVLALAEGPGENAQVWARLPGVYWHYPVRREKPVATVLLRHSSPRMRTPEGGQVLLATQFFGSGRTGFLAFDTTWRWRRYGERYFNRFWIQLLRHLVEGKLLSGQNRGLIQFERETYAVGEPVTLEARLLDARHLPMRQEQVQAGLHVEGQPDRQVPLAAQPNRPGWYRGRFVPTQAGTHGVQIDLPGGEGAPPASIRGEVRVGQPDLEFRQPELDRAALQMLAEQSAGGKYLEVDEIGQLPRLIPSRTTTIVLTGQPISLWDRWWTLALLVGLLSVEWALRKRAKLL